MPSFVLQSTRRTSRSQSKPKRIDAYHKFCYSLFLLLIYEVLSPIQCPNRPNYRLNFRLTRRVWQMKNTCVTTHLGRGQYYEFQITNYELRKISSFVIKLVFRGGLLRPPRFWSGLVVFRRCFLSEKKRCETRCSFRGRLFFCDGLRLIILEG